MSFKTVPDVFLGAYFLVVLRAKKSFPTPINPVQLYYTLGATPYFFSAVDFIYYSIVLLGSELCFYNHPPERYFWGKG